MAYSSWGVFFASYEVGIMGKIHTFLADEEGLTVVEYVVGAGLLVVGFAGLFAAFRDILTAEFATLFS
ncbi:hypothetical protein KO511_17905 [Vibrio hepatarius]|nr:hypothetical protein [Vibrio hepatarius]MBU2898572.1 hypothetical protein [Vibrio hepatarius]